ncbi:hypothetical protein NY538_10585, partial [Enterobacter hormaechei]|uniref:hypothetical protein n=1 Tax=Enterobacter hormaechei TaxID=158836 RepID=UPI0022F058B8
GGGGGVGGPREAPPRAISFSGVWAFGYEVWVWGDVCWGGVGGGLEKKKKTKTKNNSKQQKTTEKKKKKYKKKKKKKKK